MSNHIPERTMKCINSSIVRPVPHQPIYQPGHGGWRGREEGRSLVNRQALVIRLKREEGLKGKKAFGHAILSSSSASKPI